MRVRIHDLSGEDVETYVCECVEDCKNETHRQVYGLCVRYEDVTTMGKVIGEPARERRK